MPRQVGGGSLASSQGGVSALRRPWKHVLNAGVRRELAEVPPHDSADAVGPKANGVADQSSQLGKQSMLHRR
jgi:hypothetical protein